MIYGEMGNSDAPLNCEEQICLVFENPSLLKRYFEIQAFHPSFSMEELLHETFSEINSTSKVDKRQKTNPWETLKSFINNPICPVVISRELPYEISAVYMSERNCVLINEDCSLQNLLRGISQEMAHASLDNGEKKYSRQENAFSAYCISYVVCIRLGVSSELFTMDLPPAFVRDRDVSEMKNFLESVKEKANEIAPAFTRVQMKDRYRDESR